MTALQITDRAVFAAAVALYEQDGGDYVEMEGEWEERDVYMEKAHAALVEALPELAEPALVEVRRICGGILSDGYATRHPLVLLAQRILAAIRVEP